MTNHKATIKKLTETAIIPEYETPGSVGMNLYADTPCGVTIYPGRTGYVHTGIKVTIPQGYAGVIYTGTGSSDKKGLVIADGINVIDHDSEVIVKLQNITTETKFISAGDQIARMMVVPYVRTDISDETDRII